MTFPEVQLVDAPTSGATVLFDFNDTTLAASREVEADGFTLGAPELDGDVDAVDPLYGPRVVGFTWRLRGTKATALAAQSALARRVMAGPSWLRVRLHATATVKFFRAYRMQPGELSFDDLYSTSTISRDKWAIEVAIPCEGIGYSERVTQVAQTVNNNPAHATNPCRIILPPISGDAPTRLRLGITPSFDSAGYRYMTSLLSSPAAQSPTLLQVGTGDSFTAGVNTGSGSTDASYSGGSFRSTSFSTATMQVRLSTTVSLIPGRYRVLARVAPEVETFVGRFQVATTTTAGPPMTSNLPPFGTSYFPRWVDLGTLSPVRNGDPSSLAPVSTALTIAAERTAGTGALRWDAILLVPLHNSLERSSQAMFSAFTNTAIAGISGSNAGTWDGDAEAFYAADSSVAADMAGAFHTVTPGNAHVLTLLTNVDPARSAATPQDSISTTASVVVSYHPRWLWLGDS